MNPMGESNNNNHHHHHPPQQQQQQQQQNQTTKTTKKTPGELRILFLFFCCKALLENIPMKVKATAKVCESNPV